MPRAPAARLRKLEEQRAHLLGQLLRSGPLLRGSLCLVQRTCGKLNCHCATKPAHPVWVLATRRKGIQRCQVVRKADVEQVQQRVGSYREFRAALRRLQAIEDAERELLSAWMESRAVTYD